MLLTKGFGQRAIRQHAIRCNRTKLRAGTLACRVDYGAAGRRYRIFQTGKLQQTWSISTSFPRPTWDSWSTHSAWRYLCDLASNKGSVLVGLSSDTRYGRDQYCCKNISQPHDRGEESGVGMSQEWSCRRRIMQILAGGRSCQVRQALSRQDEWAVPWRSLSSIRFPAPRVCRRAVVRLPKTDSRARRSAACHTDRPSDASSPQSGNGRYLKSTPGPRFDMTPLAIQATISSTWPPKRCDKLSGVAVVHGGTGRGGEAEGRAGIDQAGPSRTSYRQ